MNKANETQVRDALQRLLWELPAEFREAPRPEGRSLFRVAKRSNVLAVHQALWDLQVATGMTTSSPETKRPAT